MTLSHDRNGPAGSSHSAGPTGNEGSRGGESVGDWPRSRPTAIAAELRWVHDMLRKDMLVVQRLATRVSQGDTPGEVEAELRRLQTSGPLFKLRANCLTFCQTLHAHHHGEDAVLFPAVRQAAPQLVATIDKLEDDHREVASLVQDVERLTSDLGDDQTRTALIEALDRLSATLLEHLEFEETTLQPVLESWEAWPTRF